MHESIIYKSYRIISTVIIPKQLTRVLIPPPFLFQSTHATPPHLPLTLFQYPKRTPFAQFHPFQYLGTEKICI